MRALVLFRVHKSAGKDATRNWSDYMSAMCTKFCIVTSFVDKWSRDSQDTTAFLAGKEAARQLPSNIFILVAAKIEPWRKVGVRYMP